MPSKPKTPCPKCPRGLWDGKHCPACGYTKPTTGWKPAAERGTAYQRGYDRRWRAARTRKLAITPLCEQCETEGVTQEAQEVHHIQPFTGRTDPLRLRLDNLRSLCRRCHSKESAEASNQKGPSG